MGLKTLVMGASENPSRYAYKAANMLMAHDHETVLYGKRKGKIMDVPILDTFPNSIPNLDTVTLYLNPLNQREYYDLIVGLKPRRVIFNPGTENEEFVSILHKNQIETDEACTLVLLSTGQYES